MIVGLGTQNPPKITAITSAVKVVYPGEVHKFVSGPESSEVSDHPTNPYEARLGALCRALGSQRRHPDADIWVGLEGGLEEEVMPRVENGRISPVKRWHEYGFVVAIDRDGNIAEGRSSGLAIPDHYLPTILGGGDLNQAIEIYHGIRTIGNHGGATQLLTGGVIDRTDSYIPGIILTLSQLKMKHFYQTPA